MPRRSTEALSLVPNVDGRPTHIQPRSDAPESVRKIMLDLIASMPPEHFRNGDRDLLEMHAEGIVLGRQAFDELERNGPVVNGRPSPWLVVLEKAHRSCAVLAARLRLAPQMRLDPKTVHRKNGPVPSAYDLMRMERDDSVC
jgi:hypothetical protein